MSSERFCILINKCLGKKREKKFMKSSTSKVEILPGTLLLLLDSVRNSPYESKFVLETLDQEDIEVTCSLEQFSYISSEEYNLLITVPTCADRFAIYTNKEWINEGLKLKEGDFVEFYDKNSARELLGKLRYKGKVTGLEGIYFGVELLYDRGLGHSDGTFRKERFFQCAPESAVFVGLHRIRQYKGPPPQQNLEGSGQAARNLNNHITTVNGLKLGDRVVWISDNGPEAGVVKWIGILPDSPSNDDITVGVEFDNPVGTGTGKYRDQRLFTARQNHASLVPILGLMKESELMPSSKQENDSALAFADADFTGKTQEQVIEEQRQILETARLSQRLSPRLPADGSKQPEVKQEKRSSSAVVHAQVHAPPASFSAPLPASSKVTEDSKVINPLYEMSRRNHEYLPDKLGEVAATPQVTVTSSQPNSRHKSHPEPDPELTKGSLVEVMSSKPLYGVIKWIGNLPDQKEPKKLIAGLEMEEETTAGTDGTFGTYRLFQCPPRKGLFVPLYKCRKDKRFIDDRRSQSSDRSINFGSTETPDLPGIVSPPDSLSENIGLICGKGRGIQGHHNSCYMDATLLAMFYFTTAFDSILHRPKNALDLPEYAEVQQVLKEGIVNPLRRHHYVRADKMMKLRKLLDKVGKIPGMMSEEKDPEEFLNLLLHEITKAEPFLTICSEDNENTQHTYFYQLIMEKDEKLILPTTQQLFELSFLQMGIKLKEVPSCLIIQMPRFGKDYKMYRRILPSLELDITDVLESAPRECIICGDLALYECKECYQVHGAGLNTIAFCDGCKKTSHQHKQRVNHKCRKISVPPGFRDYYLTCKLTDKKSVVIPREKMELFAVICIQTSHYVSFVKSGKGKDAKWIFFDSMADRMGEQSGYNIPEIRECSEIPLWLSDAYYNDIMKSPDDKALPEHMRRLICDAYICMYQSPHVMMFK